MTNRKQWGDPKISVRIPARELEKLHLVVAATGLSVSDLLREGVQKVLDEYSFALDTKKDSMQ